MTEELRQIRETSAHFREMEAESCKVGDCVATDGGVEAETARAMASSSR